MSRAPELLVTVMSALALAGACRGCRVARATTGDARAAK
jgi:Fe-S cluster biogenesis protein NfuA